MTERDVVPDFVLRAGMRYLLAQRAREVGALAVSAHIAAAFIAPPLTPAFARLILSSQTAVAGEEYHARLQAFRDELAGMPVAVQVRRLCVGVPPLVPSS